MSIPGHLLPELAWHLRYEETGRMQLHGTDDC
jgi:hypothetical protein